MRAESWILPSAIMTLGSYVSAFMLPHWTGMPSPSSIFGHVIIFWLSTLLLVVVLFVVWKPIVRIVRREPQPLSSLRESTKPAPVIGFAVGYLLVALNLTAFGFIKPQLGHLVAFSADPWLADIDRQLFLGTDGWQRLAWLHHQWLPQIYHQGWFGVVFFTFFFVLGRSQCEERNALLVCYFSLWSIFGPLVHIAIPAAGPVFWQELGLGNRFAAIPMADQTVMTKHYLWEGYVGKIYNAGGGNQRNALTPPGNVGLDDNSPSKDPAILACHSIHPLHFGCISRHWLALRH